ncbi:hypothetical protein FRC10_011202 [Ceratobasidium sp. 414]|nr:hypothetical protein FRC10_011202 [Ceratobasidium sp. 414]
MPLQPTAKIPLLFLVDAAVKPGDNVYDVHPWTNSPFRHLCGLKLLRDDCDNEDDNVEGEGNRYADTTDGFMLTDEAMRSMKEKDLEYFTVDARRNITRFLAEVHKHTAQLRKDQLNPTDEASKRKRHKRKKKDTPTTCDDDSDKETFVD